MRMLPKGRRRPDVWGHDVNGRECVVAKGRETLRSDHAYPGDGYPERWFRWNGEKRPPRAGEYYLSGAVITAYRANADLSYGHYIAIPVRILTCPCCDGSGRIAKGD